MAFLGVEFNENDGGGIEIVHSNWCTPRKKEVFWPPFKTKQQFSAALKKGDSPNEDTWQLFKIKRCFFTIENYDQANTTLKKYQISSDVTSDDEDKDNQPLAKRRSIPPRRLSYSSDDDAGQISKEITSRRPPRIDVGSYINNVPPSGSSSLATTVTLDIDSTDVTYPSTKSVHSFQPSPSSSVAVDNKSQKDRILPLLLLIKEQNTQILKWINQQNTLSISNNLPQLGLPEEISTKCPISTMPDLQAVENYLVEKNNLTLTIRYFASLGGRDIISRVNNIMKKLLSNELAKNFSFLGSRAEKQAFTKLNIKQVVIGAVQLTCSSATENELCGHIKVWLKHAPQRLVNEQKRRARAIC